MNPVQGQGACGWSPHQDQVPGVDGSPTLPGMPAVETWQPPDSREYRSHVFTVSIASNYEERGTEWGGRQEAESVNRKEGANVKFPFLADIIPGGSIQQLLCGSVY